MNNGAFGENFPYSNFHDLNMDWIIKIAKDFLDQYTHIQETIDTGLENLDNKAEELKNLLQQWYDTHSEDIANQLASALNDINTALTTAVNSFAVQAHQKAEEALESIPADYTQLGTEVADIKNSFLQGFTPNSYKPGYLNTKGALVSSATDWSTTPFYPILSNIIGVKGHVSSLSGTGYNICFYDSNRTFISGALIDNSIAETTIETIAPANAKLFRFSNTNQYFSSNKLYLIHDYNSEITCDSHFRKMLINLKFDGYINTSGNLVGADPWGTTDYIYVHGNTYTGLEGVFYNLGNNGYNISLYDKYKKFIRGYGIYNYDVKFMGQKIDTENAYYMRISSNRTYFNPCYVIYSYRGSFKNLINRNDVISNYYVDYSTGNIIQNSGYGVTPFIPVMPSGVYRYTVKKDIGNEYAIQQCAFYDENMKYVSGLPNTGVTHSVTIVLPSNVYYIRWTIKLNYQKIQLEAGTVETDYERYYPYDTDPAPCLVGSTREITSVLEALKELPVSVPIILDSETFNIINEYTNYYGAGYWSNYEGYNTADPFDRGLWLAKGRKLSGTARTIISCMHDNSNANVTRYFSVFANTEDVVLENLMIEMNYVRYAIHDDFSNTIGNGTIIFRNIKFSGHSTGQVIGGGMGHNNTYIIENCIFKINESTWDIHYHNSTGGFSDNVNKIYVRNCWGYRDIGIEAYGSAQTLSSMMVSSCKFRNYSAYRPEDTTVAPYMNVEMIEWCNQH